MNWLVLSHFHCLVLLPTKEHSAVVCAYENTYVGRYVCRISDVVCYKIFFFSNKSFTGKHKSFARKCKFLRQTEKYLTFLFFINLLFLPFVPLGALYFSSNVRQWKIYVMYLCVFMYCKIATFLDNNCFNSSFLRCRCPYFSVTKIGRACCFSKASHFSLLLSCWRHLLYAQSCTYWNLSPASFSLHSFSKHWILLELQWFSYQTPSWSSESRCLASDGKMRNRYICMSMKI